MTRQNRKNITYQIDKAKAYGLITHINGKPIKEKNIFDDMSFEEANRYMVRNSMRRETNQKWNKKNDSFGTKYTKDSKIVYILPRPLFGQNRSIFRVSIWKDKDSSPLEKEFFVRKEAENYANNYMETH